MLSYAKNTEEEASSRHKGESLLSDSSDSDDNDDDDDETGAKDNTCYGDTDGDGANASNGGGDSTGAGEGSAEWMQFLSPSALSEMLGAMAKAKESSSKKFDKNLKLGKTKEWNRN